MTFAPSFGNFEDIPSMPGAFDVPRQAKILLNVPSFLHWVVQSYDSFFLYSGNTALSNYF